MEGLYILVDKVPVQVTKMEDWIENFKSNEKRIVKQDSIGDVFVSTIFLAIDHSFSRGEGPPILFETMIFRGIHDQYQERYSTWEEAEEGHERAIKLVNDTNNGESNNEGEYNQASDREGTGDSE